MENQITLNSYAVDSKLGDKTFDSLVNIGPDFNYKLEVRFHNFIAFFRNIDIPMIDDCVAFSANIDFLII